MKASLEPGPLAAPRPGDAVRPIPSFDYHPLTRVVFGPGALARLGEIVRDMGGRRVLVITDPGLKEAGHPQRAAEFLRAARLVVDVFDGVEENPSDRHVEAGLAAARRHQADFLVAVGGGSSMDCVKGVNFLLTNGGRMADYRGFGKASRPMLPSVAVPTTAGTGSEAQSYALIADEGTHMKMACGDRKAAFRAAVLDPEVTITQPARVTTITGLDALAHAVESFVSTRRNPLSQTFAREAWRMLETSLPVAVQDPCNVEARGAMQLGAHYAGVSIENSMLGAAHALANPLTAHYGITHGLAVAVMLPHVIRFNAPVVGPLYADLARDAGLVNGDPAVAAASIARRVTELLQIVGLPTTLTQCGVSTGILTVLAVEAAEQWTGRFNPRPLAEADLHALYEAAL